MTSPGVDVDFDVDGGEVDEDMYRTAAFLEWIKERCGCDTDDDENASTDSNEKK